MPNSDIDKLIEKFNKMNGGSNNYSQRDLLKYLITRIDELDGKLENTNGKLDNHITHLSQRITAIETCISNFKWIFGAVAVCIFGLFIEGLVL